MSPFSCQAKRDIKYFPSRARARQDRSGALERGDTEREREGEGRSEEGWEEEKDKEAENCASRENGKPENDHQPKAHATPFPYHTFASFFLSLSPPLIFYPSLFPPSPRFPARLLDTTPAIVCARLVDLYHASRCTQVPSNLPVPPLRTVRFKSAFEILKPPARRRGYRSREL